MECSNLLVNASKIDFDFLGSGFCICFNGFWIFRKLINYGFWVLDKFEILGFDEVGYPDYLEYDLRDAKSVLSWAWSLEDNLDPSYWHNLLENIN